MRNISSAREKRHRCGFLSRTSALVLAAVLTATAAAFLARPASGARAEEELTPQNLLSYVVFEQETGQIIYTQNALATADPGLLSRMMCAVVVLEYTSDGKSLMIPDNVVPKENSVSYDGKYRLTAGSSYTIGQLLRAMLLCGADNCARALAEHINPNSDYFVSLMNQTAARLEMKDTYFTSPDGAYSTLSRTTVNDMMLFYQYALKITNFRNIVQSEFNHIWGNTAVFNLCTLPFSLKATYGTTVAGGLFQPSSDSLPGTLVMNITLPAGGENAVPMKLGAIVQNNAGTDQLNTFARSLISDANSSFRKTKVFGIGDAVGTYDVAKQSLSLEAAAELYLVVPSDVAPVNYVQSVTYTFLGGTYSGQAMNALELTPPITEGQQLGLASLLLRDGSTHSLRIKAGNTIQTDNARVNSLLNLIESYRPLFIIIAALLAVELYVVAAMIIHAIRRRVSARRSARAGKR